MKKFKNNSDNNSDIVNHRSFKARWDNAKQSPTPLDNFVSEVCKVTGKKPTTVRMWYYGIQGPTSETLAKLVAYFDTPAVILFPNLKNK